MDTIYGHLQFFAYIIAGFLGLTVIALIVIMFKHKQSGNRDLFRAARNFILTSFLIGLMYFLSYYRVVMVDDYRWFTVFRAFDIVLYIFMAFFWIEFITELTNPNRRITSHLLKNTKLIFILFAILQTINYVFFVDENYYVPNEITRIYVEFLQVIMCLFLIIITIIYVVKCLRETVKKFDRLFIIVNSILINLNGLWNGITVIMLFNGDTTLESMEQAFNDPTAILFTLTNLSTLYFLYRHDFSPIYFSDEEDDDTSDNGIICINTLSEQYRLTHRERDILTYVYNGYHNPEIAEKLSISKYTVRNHLHSAFEKLDVNNRIELLHLINEYKDR